MVIFTSTRLMWAFKNQARLRLQRGVKVPWKPTFVLINHVHFPNGARLVRMCSREDLTSRSVLITGLPDNVNVLDFVNGYLSQNGIKKTAKSVDYVGESDETRGKPGYVVLLASKIDAGRILVEHQVSECRYEGGVSTISAMRCPEELIPDPWLEDPPRYNTMYETRSVKQERPPPEADSQPPPKDAQPEEQTPLTKHNTMCDPVTPEQPLNTDLRPSIVAESSVTPETEESFPTPPSKTTPDFLKQSPAPQGYQEQIPKSQPCSEKFLSQDSFQGPYSGTTQKQLAQTPQISHGQIPQRSSQVYTQTSQQNTQDVRYQAPQGNLNVPQNFHRNPGGSPILQRVEHMQNIPPGPAPPRLQPMQHVYSGPALGMPNIGQPQNMPPGSSSIHPSTLPPYPVSPPQRMQSPLHTQYGNTGRFPQPDPRRYYGAFPQNIHPTQGQPFPTQQQPYENPTQSQPYQLQMQGQPYPNQTQAHPFQHSPFQPYQQRPYAPTEANYPAQNYQQGPPMNPQGAPPTAQFGTYHQGQRHPLSEPNQQHSENQVPKPIREQRQQELKSKATAKAGPTILEVKGIQSSMTEDSLKLYFENRRRSGGGEDEVIKVDMKRRKNTALVFFKDPENARKILVEHQVSECRYEGGVLTISAMRCPEELIPDPWLEDPPRYNTMYETRGVKQERPPPEADSQPPPKDAQPEEQTPLTKHNTMCDPVTPPEADSQPPPKDAQPEEQTPLTKHNTMCDPVTPEQPLNTDLRPSIVAESSVTPETEESFPTPPSKTTPDFLKQSPAPQGYQEQIPKSQPCSEKFLSQDSFQGPYSGTTQKQLAQTPQISHGQIPQRSSQVYTQTSQQNTQDVRYQAPQGNLNVPQNFHRNPGGSPILQRVEHMQNIPPGPAPPRLQPMQHVYSGPALGMPNIGQPQNMPPGSSSIHPSTLPPYPVSPPQRMQSPLHTQYGNTGRFPQPDPRRYYGAFPQNIHPTQGQPFPTQQQPYENPTQGQPYQLQMQGQPYPNQTQAHPFQRSPFQPYQQRPYAPTEHYPQANYPAQNYPQGPPMNPQGAPPTAQFGTYHQGQRHPLSEPNQQHSENQVPKPIGEQRQQELKSKATAKAGPTILEVKGIQSSMTEDSLKLYFENRRRSGGGEDEVIKVDMKRRKNTALVFFKDLETADRVLKKKSHLINKQNVEVLAYTEPTGNTTAATDDGDDDDDEDGEDGATQEQCSIEVRGFKPNSNTETLEFYFENTKRSGGGPVTNSEKKKDVIFITFDAPEVVLNVLKRKHVVDGANLTVKLHRQTPCYKNRFLVTNISYTTSKETLTLFLEAPAGGSNVTEVLYGEVPGKALVTFEDDNIPDFGKLQLQCRKKPLERQHLQVEKVPITDSVVVRGLKKESTEETVQLYFENKKSGNTEGIQATVSTHKDDGYCIVKFEDYRAIDKILAKQHTVDGARLTVKLYVECLGLDNEDTDESWYKQPQPFSVENLDKPKCRFLQLSETDKEKLKQGLKARHAEITWLSDYSATMTCTLNKDAKDAVKLAQTWYKDTETFLRAFVDSFQTEEYTTLHQIWEDVRKGLSKIPKSKSFLMDLCEEDHKVIVVGHSTDVQTVGARVKKTIQDVEMEFQRKQKEITEPITNLKPLQLLLLVKDGYVADVQKRYPADLKVTVNAEQNEMIFKGQVNEINDCKVLMYERISRYSSQRLTLSQRVVSFLDRKDVKDIIMNKLRDMKITGMWDTDSKNQTVTVMATTEENVASVVGKLKDMIVEHHEEIDEENFFLLSSDKLATFEKTTLDRYGSLVSIFSDRQASRVVIVALDNTIDKVREELKNIIQHNSVNRQIVKLPVPVYRFLLANGDGELTEISNDLAKQNGKLDKSTAQQIAVSGPQEVLMKAVQELKSLAMKVSHKKHTLKKPGISKFINSEDGKVVIASTEKESRCVIELKFDESVQVRVEAVGSMPAPVPSVTYGRNTDGNRVIASCDIDSKRKIHVVIGDITAMKVDVIVNAANNSLQHGGGLAKAISDKGGPTIQRDSDEYTAKNKTLRAGDVVTTGSGLLPCKMVAHAVGPRWYGGHHGEEGDLKEAIMLSLEQTDRNGYKSIALPALSTGIFRYPVELATRHIVEAIKKFFTLESPNSDVTNVYMIDTNERATKLFTEALQDVYSGRRVTLTDIINRTDVRPTLATKPKPVVRPRATQGSNPSSQCKVTIVKGEIAKQKVDVVINSTSRNLDLNDGAVSKSILKAAGNTIQQELKSKYPQGIQAGDVAVSSGGKLGCRVYHVCLPPASVAGSDVLQNIIVKCLQTAADEGCRTIAFPALGAGNLGYAADFVAKHMYTAVDNFQKENTSLKEVQVVIYPKDKQVIQAFEDYKRQMQTGEITDPPVQARGIRSLPEEENFEESWTPQSKNDDLQIGRLTIQIKQGDITKEDADCIINSTNTELDLKRGAVSQAIATACGKDMTSQCKMKIEAMRQNGVVSTTAKGLKSKYVLHVAGDHFGNDWKKVVLICLREAEKLGDAHSVAFPILGTGAGYVNPQEIAKIMVQAFAEFEPEASMMADIRVVVFQQAMFLTVSSEIQESVNSMRQGTSRRTAKTGVGQVSDSSRVSTTDSSGVKFGNITVTITQGDITKEAADCIVNSTNSELDLTKGAVSGAIRKACGKDMESQCAKKVNDMRKQGVISTTAKGLKCKYVLHVSGHHFGNDWKKVVLSCLEEAEKLPGVQSVAFPLLGTGVHSIEAKDIAQIMTQAFVEFGSRAVSICDVRVVVFQQAMLKPFAAVVMAGPGAIPKATSIITRGSTAPGTVDLYFFSDRPDAIASGIKKLEARCEKEWRTKKLNDHVIKKLTDQQIQILHQNLDLELKFDKSKGFIQLTGQGSVVDEANIRIIEFLRNIEKEENETERANLLSQTIQWAYFETDKTTDKKDFDTKENAEIEKAFNDNKTSCKVKVQKTTMEIDFSSMQGKEKKKTYSLIRRDLMQEAKQSDFDLPKNWQPMADDVNVQRLTVAADSEEFKTVDQKFMATINNSNAKVLKVDRIQNRSLYQQYTAKRKQLEKQNPQGTQNECWLWHGTSTDAIDSINAHGFNRSYCGKNATYFGQGVYFAVNAEYSAQDTYSRPDPQGQQYMYLVQVLTGEYTKGDGTMRVPPPKAGTMLFDSVVNDMNNPAMFVVFHDSQAYPDYLVTFHP